MSWAHPSWLALLLLVPVVAVGMFAAWKARLRALARYAAAPMLAQVLSAGKPDGAPSVLRARAAQAWLSVVGVASLCLAVAGPRLGYDWQTQPMQGVTLVAVLDVSRSMDAADAPPSRLEQARRELEDLVGYLRGDAIGLVVFAAGSYARIPPTVDYDTFQWAVRDSSSDTLQAQGTSLAGAIDGATLLLERAKGSGKAILVLSDGEDHGSDMALQAATRRAQEAGIRIFAMGIGTPEGAPVPVAGGGFKKDRDGSVVVSKLDEAALQALAQQTGGAYVRAVPSDEDVRALVEDEIRGKLAANQLGVRRERVWHERFAWPLAVALAAMALSAALGVGRRPRVGGVAALALLALFARAEPALAGAGEDGAAAWRAKRWDDAVRLLGQARVEDPSDHDVTWMLGDALLQSGRSREAERLFRDLAARDPGRKAQHLYNAGHAAYRGGRLEQAAKDFEAARDAEPAFGAAAKNADAVRKEIATRRSPPPPRNQQQQGNEPQQGQTPSGEAQQGGEGASGPTGDAQATGTPGDAGASKGKPGDAKANQPQGEAPSEPLDVAGAEDGGVRDPSGEGAPSDAAASSGENAEAAPTGSDGAAPTDAAIGGSMTPDAASRLVDAVPDGHPRVTLHGETTEEDW